MEEHSNHEYLLMDKPMLWQATPRRHHCSANLASDCTHVRGGFGCRVYISDMKARNRIN